MNTRCVVQPVGRSLWAACRSSRPAWLFSFGLLDGLQVWDNRTRPRRLAARDRQDERDGRGFEVRSSRFLELRTPNFELRIALVARFTATAVAPADFFSTLQVT